MTDSRDQSSSQRRSRSVWKKLLFALLTACLFFLAVELVLALGGVRLAHDREDPFVGFAGNIPLFVPLEADRTQMATAQNKVRYFNPQQFDRQKPPGTYRIFTLGGSTTYGRPYTDVASFSGHLRQLLAVADPTRRWQVINAGGISYASYRVAVVLGELAEYEPDLFILYTGHNEFLERRTYAEMFEYGGLRRRVLELLGHSRIYASFTRLAGSGTDASTTTLKAEVDALLDKSIGPQDYYREDLLFQQVVGHFRFNLNRMIDTARTAGAQVVLVVPASNLKDCGPFKSEHTENLTLAQEDTSAALLSRARALHRAKHYEDSLGLLNQALAIDERFAELHYRRGSVLHDLGRYREAKTAFRRAIDEDVCPLRAPSAITQVVRDVAQQRNVPLVDFARTVEQRADHGIPDSEQFLDHVHLSIDGYRALAVLLIDTLVDRGVVTLSEQWNEQAIEAVSQQVASQIDAGEHGRAIRTLARVFAWAGKYEEAQRLLEQALANLGPDFETFSLIGRSSAAQGNQSKAIETFRRALELNPDSALVHKYLGAALQLTGASAEALEHYFAALRLDPDDAEANYNVGTLYEEQEKLDEAIAAYERAIRQRPDLAEAHHNLARVLLRRGRTTQAIASFRRALEINPRFVLVHEQLADVLVNTGQIESAMKHYRRAFEEDPRSPIAINSLAWLLATIPDDRLRNPAEALALAQRAASITNNPSVLDTLAAAHAANGQFDHAVTIAQKAIDVALSMKGPKARDLAAQIRERLEMYQLKKPFRDTTILSRHP